MHKLTSCILAGLLALCTALPVQAKQVSFRAISNPDFSKIVTIHVPDGWKHRNGEGMMELTPPNDDGAVCVEVFTLQGRTVPEMATLLANGKTLDKCPEREDAWQWTTSPDVTRNNFFVGSVRDDVYVHFSWHGIDDSAIMAILAKSVMAGVPVAAQVSHEASHQQGHKEVKGRILKEVPYRDSRGDNVVILSRSDRDGDTRSSDLYAYGYTNDGASPLLSWKMYDYLHGCSVDLAADFSEQSPIITDLDKNGISEVWLVYYIGCRGDIGPIGMKIIMYEGSRKYALRGETFLAFDGMEMGGRYTADPAFDTAPSAFRQYADKLWQKYKKRF